MKQTKKSFARKVNRTLQEARWGSKYYSTYYDNGEEMGESICRRVEGAVFSDETIANLLPDDMEDIIMYHESWSLEKTIEQSTCQRMAEDLVRIYSQAHGLELPGSTVYTLYWGNSTERPSGAVNLGNFFHL